MKKVIFFSLLLLSVTTGFSQRFINGVGVCVFSTGGDGFSSFITGGIPYSPRVNIVESDNSAISLGLPMSIGLSYHASTDGNSNASALVNIPFVINYNFGCGSTRQNESRFG